MCVESNQAINLVLHDLTDWQSCLIELITVFDAILTDRQSGQKLISVFMGIRWQITFPKILNFTQFVSQNVKTLGRRLFSPSLKGVAWLVEA